MNYWLTLPRCRRSSNGLRKWHMYSGNGGSLIRRLPQRYRWRSHSPILDPCIMYGIANQSITWGTSIPMVTVAWALISVASQYGELQITGSESNPNSVTQKQQHRYMLAFRKDLSICNENDNKKEYKQKEFRPRSVMLVKIHGFCHHILAITLGN